MAQCCLCNGHLVLLGQLGRTKQFCCRQCGMIFSAVRPLRQDQSEDQTPIKCDGLTHEENQHEENQNVAP